MSILIPNICWVTSMKVLALIYSNSNLEPIDLIVRKYNIIR